VSQEFELLRQRLIKAIPLANPGAGAEWIATVPAGAAWELLSANFSFTASAAVANRIPTVQFKDDTGVRYARINANVTVAASIGTSMSFQAGIGSTLSGNASGIALPGRDLPLMAGHQVGSLTSALDVADVYASVVLVVREWTLDGARAAAEWLGRRAAA
jgi:hypothetical protein